jgi:hypothetical protein
VPVLLRGHVVIRLRYERARQRLLWWLTATGRVHLAVAVVAAAALVSVAGHPVPVCDTDASCAALGVGTGYGVTAEKIATYGPVFVAEDHTLPAVWECLRGLGYVGSPLDGVEALYVPQSDFDDCSR